MIYSIWMSNPWQDWGSIFSKSVPSTFFLQIFQLGTLKYGCKNATKEIAVSDLADSNKILAQIILKKYSQFYGDMSESKVAIFLWDFLSIKIVCYVDILEIGNNFFMVILKLNTFLTISEKDWCILALLPHHFQVCHGD